MNGLPQPLLIALSLFLVIWIFIWKGIALWHAAKHGQKRWFIALIIFTFPPLLFNAVGIIDIVYLFSFAKKKLTLQEIKSWFKKSQQPKHHSEHQNNPS